MLHPCLCETTFLRIFYEDVKNFKLGSTNIFSNLRTNEIKRDVLADFDETFFKFISLRRVYVIEKTPTISEKHLESERNVSTYVK